MPVLIAIAVAAPGFLWWAWGRHRAGEAVARKMDGRFLRSPCKWDREGPSPGGLVEYRCSARAMSRAMSGYLQTGRPPVTCKHAMRGRT